MVFVGDSLMDAAKSAEMKVFFVGKVGTFSRSDFVTALSNQAVVTISQISEILDIVEK
jgi:hypothetical protein